MRYLILRGLSKVYATRRMMPMITIIIIKLRCVPHYHHAGRQYPIPTTNHLHCHRSGPRCPPHHSKLPNDHFLLLLPLPQTAGVPSSLTSLTLTLFTQLLQCGATLAALLVVAGASFMATMWTTSRLSDKDRKEHSPHLRRSHCFFQIPLWIGINGFPLRTPPSAANTAPVESPCRPSTRTSSQVESISKLTFVS